MQNLEAEAIRLIKLKLKEKDWTSTDLAQKIGMHPSSVAKMLASDQIKLDRLKLISELLDYNFFEGIGRSDRSERQSAQIYHGSRHQRTPPRTRNRECNAVEGIGEMIWESFAPI